MEMDKYLEEFEKYFYITCPYCSETLTPNHTNFWTGMRSIVIKIEFRCYGKNHNFSIFARNELEYDMLKEYCTFNVVRT